MEDPVNRWDPSGLFWIYKDPPGKWEWIDDDGKLLDFYGRGKGEYGLAYYPGRESKLQAGNPMAISDEIEKQIGRELDSSKQVCGTKSSPAYVMLPSTMLWGEGGGGMAAMAQLAPLLKAGAHTAQPLDDPSRAAEYAKLDAQVKAARAQAVEGLWNWDIAQTSTTLGNGLWIFNNLAHARLLMDFVAKNPDGGKVAYETKYRLFQTDKDGLMQEFKGAGGHMRPVKYLEDAGGRAYEHGVEARLLLPGETGGVHGKAYPELQRDVAALADNRVMMIEITASQKGKALSSIAFRATLRPDMLPELVGSGSAASTGSKNASGWVLPIKYAEEYLKNKRSLDGVVILPNNYRPTADPHYSPPPLSAEMADLLRRHRLVKPYTTIPAPDNP